MKKTLETILLVTGIMAPLFWAGYLGYQQFQITREFKVLQQQIGEIDKAYKADYLNKK